MLAAQCLREIRELGLIHDVRDRVRQALLGLTRFGLSDEPEKSGNNLQDGWPIRRRAVQELARGWRDDPDTAAWLKEHAAHDGIWDIRWVAVDELGHGWKQDPDTVALLKHVAAHEDNLIVRWVAVHGLVQGSKEDPDTLALLKHFAAHATDVYQYVAVEALEQGWKEDPEVREFVAVIRKTWEKSK